MNQKLKSAIDRMVEDSIRRILPQVMNEVLIKTIASSGVVQESRGHLTKEQAAAPIRPPVRAKHLPSSLSQLLDPEAGSDFYQDPRAAMAESIREEEPAPRGQVIAQRIQNLPPGLQHLAEDVNMDDDGGEMWESDVGDSVVTSGGMGPPLDRAAAAVGLDFSRMKQSIQLTERKSSKQRVSAAEQAANAQFEENRLKRMREKLDA